MFLCSIYQKCKLINLHAQAVFDLVNNLIFMNVNEIINIQLKWFPIKKQHLKWKQHLFWVYINLILMNVNELIIN